MKFFALWITSVVATLVFVSLANSQSVELEQYNLFPEMGGYRTALERNGLQIESIITTDVVSNVSGGIKRDTVFLANYDLVFALDTRQAGFWDGGKAFFYLLANDGREPSKLVGDLQTTDNIEAEDSIKVFEAWYEHAFSNNSLGLLFGLHDYNSEFYVSEYGLSLLNRSFGTGADVAQVNPSIFPTSALGVRLRYNPSEAAYFLAALYDGVPGNPNNPRGTHIRFDSGDGLFHAFEAGARKGEGYDYYKAAFGVWYSTAKFRDFTDTSQNNNHGFYIVLEKSLFAEAEDEAQGLGAFLQFGRTKQSRNKIGQYLGLGLNYTGLISSRENDVLSFGVANAMISTNYKRINEASDSFETAIELNYRAVITSYFAITPDVQWVINPGARKEVEDAFVFSVRMELAM